ncbi:MULTISPECIES: hypothetical protein [unclassified Tolypothrix]|uniref:hypothetical protein n=1 Tax=unclassified Tolypothrix TaxID=2649714 RepID=UPI0005EAA58E|nr:MULTISPECIES: hypothetical protein [unclassified Tolypothrix]BAY94956.1 hypothetical protein NIES3275_70110 [Microchaete diplosiphon NIES-3275]EKE97108.1 hypothetical protein FDUTEX481_06002 [Tolypothrix sp. PCC 7601]MBE9086721.1 hypothetical protein [Tolypothrix sp. LEGE 11397]UYD28593.1 hypothetical protein HGR01_11460 [Tolypothrix sp. PCC 7712]UYD35497.1 hypothetical protein HG267_06915 [Tolypothrix sp. PCC 7601]
MQIITGGAKNNNIIGQRYEVISTPTQISPWETLSLNTANLNIRISIESPFTAELPSQLHQNSVLLVKCLSLISMLFATSTTEGLQEASEALERMVEYYNDSGSDLQQTTLPQSLGVITGNLLPSEVRPPLIIDFE